MMKKTMQVSDQYFALRKKFSRSALNQHACLQASVPLNKKTRIRNNIIKETSR